jgi:hypothetical protein
MRIITLKTSFTITVMIVFLLSANSINAQMRTKRYLRRLPDKPFKLESKEDEVKQSSTEKINPESVPFCGEMILSENKSAMDKGPCLLNGINLRSSIKNYIGASVFNKPNYVNGLFKRKYSPSFK